MRVPPASRFLGGRAGGVVLLLALLGLGLSGCTRPTMPEPPPAPFEEFAPTPTAVDPAAPLFVIGHIASDEQRPHMEALLARFSEQSGVAVRYEGEPLLPELLRRVLEEGEVPDLILLPVPNWVGELASAGVIRPLDPPTDAAVRANFGAAWQSLVTVDGTLYGVPFDGVSKSLLFARPGLIPPDGFADLAALEAFAAERAAQGEPTFAVPGLSGWPLTDTFENVLLISAGPEIYDALRDHRIPWTDPAVERAMRQWLTLLQDDYVVGGAEGATTLSLRSDTFAELFGPAAPPTAALWWGADSVVRDSGLSIPDEIEIARFPGRSVVGAGSVMVATNERRPTLDLLHFLAQPEAVRPWVEAGGFISPNHQVPLEAYPSALARAQALELVEADPFRYDLSDRLPPQLGGTFLFDRLKAVLLSPEDLPRILEEIERVATREQGSPP